MRKYAVYLVILLVCTHSYVWVRKKKEKSSPRKVITATSGVSESSASSHLGKGTATFDVYHNGDWSSGHKITLTAQDCAKSVDLGEILCPKFGIDSTCSLYSAVGTRVISCHDLKIDNSVFIVPPGRFFMLPTKGVGYSATIDHIGAPDAGPIQLETLSEWPRVFRLRNFVSTSEVQQMLETGRAKVQEETLSGRAMAARDPLRTADLVYDIQSSAAVAIKRRLFDLLGVFPFQEARVDGFQVLRYNTSGAYVSHMDWLEAPNTAANEGDHSTDSGGSNISDSARAAGRGSGVARKGKREPNRYATLLLYLTDAEEGGETAFTAVSKQALSRQTQYQRGLQREDSARDSGVEEGAGVVTGLTGTVEGTEPGQGQREETAAKTESEADEEGEADEEKEGDWDRMDEDPDDVRVQAEQRKSAADAYIAKHNASTLIQAGSWQYELLGYCRTHLAVRPVRGEALLFYSQTPLGEPDYLTRHGACPLLRGEKWVANVWVWDGPRDGADSRSALPGVSASFESVDVDGAELYWEDQLWDTLSPGRAVKVNTFAGHRWQVRLPQGGVQGATPAPPSQLSLSWVIQEGRPTQRFVVSMEALRQAQEVLHGVSGSGAE